MPSEGDRQPDSLSEGLERELRALGGPNPQPADPVRLELLVSLYGASPAVVLDLVSQFVAGKRGPLRRLYRAYRHDQRDDQVARSPEALLVLERLERDPDRLQDLWRKYLPLHDLEQTAAFYGVQM
jgi:hypothetical protein